MYSQILSLCGILAISSLVLAAAPPQARATDHPDKAYFEVEDNVKAHKWKVDLSMVSVSDQARIQTYNKKHRFTLNLPISSTWMVDASLYAPPSQGQKVPDKTAGTPTPTASVWVSPFSLMCSPKY